MALILYADRSNSSQHLNKQRPSPRCKTDIQFTTPSTQALPSPHLQSQLPTASLQGNLHSATKSFQLAVSVRRARQNVPQQLLNGHYLHGQRSCPSSPRVLHPRVAAGRVGAYACDGPCGLAQDALALRTRENAIHHRTDASRRTAEAIRFGLRASGSRRLKASLAISISTNLPLQKESIPLRRPNTAQAKPRSESAHARINCIRFIIVIRYLSIPLHAVQQAPLQWRHIVHWAQTSLLICMATYPRHRQTQSQSCRKVRAYACCTRRVDSDRDQLR
ncbi:hypothetical protein BDV96DRAFT_199840 [Lophiotrema nucula]|uniref:Uncharacterized protein n=1 Tax=Lophiotrema nucula TaxID=690887 RepID=A0A6A5YTB0_9PLEO|nr:hypothetical protein BDV96DRAFT_199840 [Lophiotrema nucula]